MTSEIFKIKPKRLSDTQRTSKNIKGIVPQHTATQRSEKDLWCGVALGQCIKPL